MIARFLLISTVLATFGLASGYGLNGLWVGTALTSTMGFLWLLARQRGLGWVASAMLGLFVSAAAIGLWLGVGAGWTLLGIVGALSTWDLDHFSRRLSGLGQGACTHELERRHVRRLLVVDTLSLLLGMVALGVELEYGFGLALSLGLLAVLCLGRAIGFLRHESD